MTDLLLDRRDGLAWVTIDRPDKKHAWSPSMWGEMSRLLDECADDPEVRVVLITSTGDRVFSAGADLDQFSGANEESVRGSLEGVESVMSAIENCPQPVIAVVGGAAVGAGLEIAAVCDVRIASEQAWFSIPAADLGIVITRSDVARLVRGVGDSVARDLLLTGRRLNANEARILGFLRSVHPAHELHAAATELATGIAKLDGSALASMKVHLNSLSNVAWDEESWRDSQQALLSPRTQRRINSRLGDS